MYLVKIGKLYIVKDGELELSFNPLSGGEVYKSGAKLTTKIEEATRFTATEASRYQRIIGVKGKRGQIIKDVNKDA